MDEKVGEVLSTLKIATRDNEGVIIEPVELEDGILRVKYYEGTNQECPECVMSPDSFKEMLIRMCQMQAPYVVDVELEPAR